MLGFNQENIENLCNDGRCKKIREGLYHNAHDKTNENNEIEDSEIEGFDDIIIHQTNERISQEFSNISSLETKAGILIGFIAAMLTIILSNPVTNMFREHINKNFYGLIPAAFGILFFSVAFVIPLLVIMPRRKLALIDPRTINNELRKFELPEIKRQLRHNLIKTFEILENERNKEISAVKSSFIFLGLGSLCFIIVYFLPPLI